MLHVYKSNRVENLAYALETVLRCPAGSPHDPEWICVQSQGIRIWIGMEMSKRLGIWANVNMPFPRDLIAWLLNTILETGDQTPAKTRPDNLIFRIMHILPEFLNRPEFVSLQRYLNADNTGVRLYQLSARIAHVFDEYSVYRYDQVLKWESQSGATPDLSAEEQWQPVLWRALFVHQPHLHIAAEAARFFRQFQSGNIQTGRLPSRIILFGISTLPPLYLKILNALSGWMDIHLMIPSPSREYWATIRSKQELIREMQRHTPDIDQIDHDLFLEEGHPLLASLGRMGRDFQQVLEDDTLYQEPLDLYQDPVSDDGPASLLTMLQSDILNLRLRGPNHEPPFPISPEDRSISVHSCHSPMRELQSLKNILLNLFETDATLSPHDVIVMMPDITTTAPFIHAVFQSTDDNHSEIPYRISDVPMHQESNVIEQFLGLVGLSESRLTVRNVFDLLSCDSVRLRFDISEDDIPRLYDWVVTSGVRWGIDSGHRNDLGYPDFSENTWRSGLDRMLLGVAMPESDWVLFGDVLPMDGIDGHDAILAGKLIQFCETLFEQIRLLRRPRPLNEWATDLAVLLNRMIFQTPDNEYHHQEIREYLSDLAIVADQLEFNQRLHVDVVQQILTNQFASRKSHRGFLSGGITFCNLLPMRNIPFPVVCLLGMNDRDFPRMKNRTEFDLMAKTPRIGDRSPRHEDRYLFLEALLSARKHLIITYTGQSIKDSAVLPPSPAVSELLEAIADGYRINNESDNPILSQIVFRHPLHPFSPKYFIPGSSLCSFSKDHFETAVASIQPRIPVKPFIHHPIPMDSRTDQPIHLTDLTRFFSNPAAFFLSARLNISLNGATPDVDIREPLILNRLEEYHIGQKRLELMLDGGDVQPFDMAIHKLGKLPPGSAGQCQYSRIQSRVDMMFQQAGPVAAKTGDRPVDLVLKDVRLIGKIDHIHGPCRIVCHFGSLKARQKLSLWIHHLAMRCMYDPQMPQHSILVGKMNDKPQRIALSAGIENPGDILSDLVHLFQTGLTMPLRFFPESSLAYAEKWSRETDETRRDQAALHQAQTKWAGSHDLTGESAHPATRLLFRDTDPLEDHDASEETAFRALSLRVWLPFLHVMEQ